MGTVAAAPSGIVAVSAEALTGRQLKYYDYAMAAFVAVLICSHLIGAGKQASFTLPLIGPVIFGAGIMFFRSVMCSETS